MNSRCRLFLGLLLLTACGGRLSAQQATAWRDPSPHTVQFVEVERNVRLEVLDWGGSGRPLILLAGLGNTAHIFDEFAPKLVPEYHVYGVTRRGYGVSSAPGSGYVADRLGDDVLAVLDALKLDRTVLVGHSIAGEELSSVATRHPERVAGLIYLDAAYAYAYYDSALGDLNIDLQELRKKLEQLQAEKNSLDVRPLVQELLQTSLPGFEKDLQQMERSFSTPPAPVPPVPTANDRTSYQAWQAWQAKVYGYAMPEGELRQIHETTPEGHVGDVRNDPTVARAVIAGEQKYTLISVPVLAIFALPHGPGLFADSAALARYAAQDMAETGPQAKAVETGVLSARVVRLAGANHYVFLTNEADVLREMRSFLAELKYRS